MKINPLEFYNNQITATEFGRVDGLNSDLQPQFAGKLLNDGTVDLTASWDSANEIELYSGNLEFANNLTGFLNIEGDIITSKIYMALESDVTNTFEAFIDSDGGYLVFSLDDINNTAIGISCVPNDDSAHYDVRLYLFGNSSESSAYGLMIQTNNKSATTDVGKCIFTALRPGSSNGNFVFLVKSDERMRLNTISTSPAVIFSAPATHLGNVVYFRKGASTFIANVTYEGDFSINTSFLCSGDVGCGAGYVFQVGTTNGVSGSFIDEDDKVVTITGGIVTGIV